MSFCRVSFPFSFSSPRELSQPPQQESGAGSYLRSIGDTSGERGPQTKFATMALSRAGGAAPTSIAAAMINGVDRVLAWTRCIPGEPYCHFALPGVGAAEAAAQAAAAARAKRVQEKRVELAYKQQQRKKNHETVGAAYTDYGSKFGETCSVCTANSGCGRCSTDVAYSDGSVGTQCAGFVGNHTRWTCAGRFSTDGCEGASPPTSSRSRRCRPLSRSARRP